MICEVEGPAFAFRAGTTRLSRLWSGTRKEKENKAGPSICHGCAVQLISVGMTELLLANSEASNATLKPYKNLRFQARGWGWKHAGFRGVFEGILEPSTQSSEFVFAH